MPRKITFEVRSKPQTHHIWAIALQHLGFHGFWKGKEKDEELQNKLKAQNVKSKQTWSKSKNVLGVDSLPYGESLPKRYLQKDQAVTFNFNGFIQEHKKMGFWGNHKIQVARVWI